MNVMNRHLFVFHIIDEGLSKCTWSDYDPHRLAITAKDAISAYLTEYGYADDEDEELSTADGYAEIVLTIPGHHQEGKDIWTYSFDGEVSLRYAFQQLQEQIDALELTGGVSD